MNVRRRQPKGTRTGGEFATESRSDDVDTLDDPDIYSASAFPDRLDRLRADHDYEDPKARIEGYMSEISDAAVDVADRYEDWLDTNSQLTNYSFNNMFLVWLSSGGKASRVAGASTWRKFGYTPKAGEKQLPIMRPKMTWVTKKDPDGKEITDDKGKPVKHRVCTGMLGAGVFDISQVEITDQEQARRRPLTLKPYRDLSEEPPEGLHEDLVQAIADNGFTVQEKKLDSMTAQGVPHGYTDFHGHTVVVDSTMSPGSQAEVLAHELAHIEAGHGERENEYHAASGPESARADMEVEANAIGYALLRSNGMSRADTVQKTAAYHANWSGHHPEQAREVAERVFTVTQAVLKQHSFRNVEQTSMTVPYPDDDSNDTDNTKRRSKRRTTRSRS